MQLFRESNVRGLGESFDTCIDLFFVDGSDRENRENFMTAKISNFYGTSHGTIIIYNYVYSTGSMRTYIM